MAALKELLSDLKYYSEFENGLEQKKSSNRKQYNYSRIMKDMAQKKQDEQVKARYEGNINKAKNYVQKLGIVHNTSLDSIISIVQNGALLSIDEMEKRDISFNFRITYRGINDEMHKYVFGATHHGDPIYGLYEIKFKKEVESLPNAQFIPKSYIEYGPEVLQDYMIDISDWRNYLAEEIALNFEDPESYIAGTPVYKRPEFLFMGQIPVSYIQEINCVDEKSCTELIRRIKKEFGEDTDVLSIIKTKNE